MKIKNIETIRPLVSAAAEGEGQSGETVTFKVGVDPEGDVTGKIGDARFALKPEGVELTSGSTIQVQLDTGEILTVVPPKAETKASTEEPAKTSKTSTRKGGRASPAPGMTAINC